MRIIPVWCLLYAWILKNIDNINGSSIWLTLAISMHLTITTASVRRCHNLTIWNYTKLQILNLKWNSCFKTWFCACILNSNLFRKWFLSSDTNQQSWITWLGYLKRRNYKKITRLNKMLQLDNLTAIKSETAPSFIKYGKIPEIHKTTGSIWTKSLQPFHSIPLSGNL